MIVVKPDAFSEELRCIQYVVLRDSIHCPLGLYP